MIAKTISYQFLPLLVGFLFAIFATTATGEVRTSPMLVTSSITLDRDLEFHDTAFVVKGQNITIDFNGHTVTFNDGNIAETPNREFEDWIDNNTPTLWQVVSGSVQRVSKNYFGDYDLQITGNGTIRSSAIPLAGGKTYLAFAFIKARVGTATLSIIDSDEGTVLAQRSWDGSALSRGYASSGTDSSDLRYKPISYVSVCLELVCTGTGSFQVGLVDIKPAWDYGIVSGNYFNTTYTPDIDSTWFKGYPFNVSITNGRLVQGKGNGVRCQAVRMVGNNWAIKNVTFVLNGIHTDGIYSSYGGSLTIDGCSIESTSLSVFNRMHGVSGIYLNNTDGLQSITNTNIDGVPQAGIQIADCLDSDDTSSYFIFGNTIRHREVVTEGYGILSNGGIKDFEIAGNLIQPYQGRGIILDSSSGCHEGQYKGTLNGSIHDNYIIDLYEVKNYEYDESGLECAGIRIRNWGSIVQGHKVDIYNNTISGRTDAGGVHYVYGINITANSIADDIAIYNNTIDVTADGADRYASAIAFQDCWLNGDGSIKIHDNIFKSNREFLRFGGNDGFTASYLTLIHNSFERIINPTPTGPVLRYGYTSGTTNSNVLAANVIPNDLSFEIQSNISFEGSGTKSLCIGQYRLQINIPGTAQGTKVTLLDDQKNVLLERIAGTSGIVMLYSPTVHYTCRSGIVQRRQYAHGATFVVQIAILNGAITEIPVIMDQDKMIDVDIQSDQKPPKPPSNLRIMK
jgi:hypothetical protein